MTTNDAPADAPAPPPTNPPAPERRLTRSRDNRVIAGVCGGLGRYCGVDPVVFRIGLAVLAFFGGVGAIIYLAAWLFLPEDGDTASPAEALLGRGQSSTSTLTTAILAVIAVIVLGFALHGESVLLLALAVLGIVLLARRGPLNGAPAMPGGNPPGPSTSTTAPEPPPVPPAYAPHGPYGGNIGGGGPAAAAPPPYQTAEGPPPPYQPPPGYQPPPPPKPPKPPKERSALGRIVVSATLLVLGLMLAADRLFDVSIAAPVYAAVALAMAGAGLVAGAWFGRSRGLIGWGVILVVVLPVMTAGSGWDPDGSMGSQRWAPAAATEIQHRYEVGFGEAIINLSNVDFTDASVDTKVEVGFGHVLVHVPSNVDVTIRGHAGAGNLRLFGQESNGTDVSRTVTDLGADGAGGGKLELDAEVGFGEVEVVRD